MSRANLKEARTSIKPTTESKETNMQTKQSQPNAFSFKSEFKQANAILSNLSEDPSVYSTISIKESMAILFAKQTGLAYKAKANATACFKAKGYIADGTSRKVARLELKRTRTMYKGLKTIYKEALTITKGVTRSERELKADIKYEARTLKAKARIYKALTAYRKLTGESYVIPTHAEDLDQ
jgi:hypothetical protein